MNHSLDLRLTVSTNQEAYDAVCAHFAAQGHRAMGADGETCSYLAPNGDRCAIGAIMTEEHARLAEERYSGLSVEDICFDGALSLGEVSEDLLSDLQSAHDVPYRTVAEKRYRLRRLAEQFELEPGAEAEITSWSETL